MVVNGGVNVVYLDNQLCRVDTERTEDQDIVKVFTMQDTEYPGSVCCLEICFASIYCNH